MKVTKLAVLGLSIAAPVAVLSSPSRALHNTYAKLPMTFEKNVGQSRTGADFIARGSGYSVFLRPDEAVLALKKQREPGRIFDVSAEQKESTATIRMRLAGSGPSRAAAEEQLPGKVNYLVGNDATK